MKETHAIGIVILVLIILIPVGYFAWKVQKRVEFDLTTKDYVVEMYEARIVTLETQMEILKKRVDN